MKKNEDSIELHLRPRPAEKVSLNIPEDTLESLRRIAASRDMSCEALIKFYIGQGLRQDISKQFEEHHSMSEEEDIISEPK